MYIYISLYIKGHDVKRHVYIHVSLRKETCIYHIRPYIPDMTGTSCTRHWHSTLESKHLTSPSTCTCDITCTSDVTCISHTRHTHSRCSSLTSRSTSASDMAHTWHTHLTHICVLCITHDMHSHTATDCNTLQYTATHCNTLQHTTTHCNTTTLQHTATHCYVSPTICTHTLQLTAIHCNTLQHTATQLHCNTRQHTAMYHPRYALTHIWHDRRISQMTCTFYMRTSDIIFYTHSWQCTRICRMTCTSRARHAHLECLIHMCDMTHRGGMTHEKAFTCVTWLMNVWHASVLWHDTGSKPLDTWSYSTCAFDLPHSYVWHDSRTQDLNSWHASFMCVTWLANI